jgi:hypothetical protein
MKKKENETVKEFDVKFEKLLQQIPNNLRPGKEHLLFLYINAFPGHFGFMLKERLQRPLKRPKNWLQGLRLIFHPVR